MSDNGDNTAEPTWTTREGQIIPIREMTDMHLLNTLFYLDRQRTMGFGRPNPALPALLAEGRKRGLVASQKSTSDWLIEKLRERDAEREKNREGLNVDQIRK